MYADSRRQNNSIFFLVLIFLLVFILLKVVTLNAHAINKHGHSAYVAAEACTTAKECDYLLNDICKNGRHYRIVQLKEKLYAIFITTADDENVVTSFLSSRPGYVDKLIRECKEN